MSQVKLILRLVTCEFPISVSAEQALDFYHRWPASYSAVLITAASWRVTPEAGEEDWFEELTPDELDDEYFLDDFADATIQLWMK